MKSFFTFTSPLPPGPATQTQLLERKNIIIGGIKVAFVPKENQSLLLPSECPREIREGAGTIIYGSVGLPTSGLEGQ